MNILILIWTVIVEMISLSTEEPSKPLTALSPDPATMNYVLDAHADEMSLMDHLSFRSFDYDEKSLFSQVIHTTEDNIHLVGAVGLAITDTWTVRCQMNLISYRQSSYYQTTASYSAQRQYQRCYFVGIVHRF